MPALGKQLQVMAVDRPSVPDVFEVDYEQKDFHFAASALAETGWLA